MKVAASDHQARRVDSPRRAYGPEGREWMSQAWRKATIAFGITVLALVVGRTSATARTSVDGEVRRTSLPPAVAVDTTGPFLMRDVRLEQVENGWRLHGYLETSRLYGPGSGHVDLVGEVDSGGARVVATSRYIGTPRVHVRRRTVPFSLTLDRSSDTASALRLSFHPLHKGWAACHPEGHR